MPVAGEAQSLSISVHADAPGNDHDNLNGEYATIRNAGEAAVAVAGWRLCDAASHCFTFPAGASITAGGSVRVYTGAGRNGPDEFYMGSRRAVWNNSGDTATLTDAGGTVVVRHRYS